MRQRFLNDIVINFGQNKIHWPVIFSLPASSNTSGSVCLSEAEWEISCQQRARSTHELNLSPVPWTTSICLSPNTWTRWTHVWGMRERKSPFSSVSQTQHPYYTHQVPGKGRTIAHNFYSWTLFWAQGSNRILPCLSLLDHQSCRCSFTHCHSWHPMHLTRDDITSTPPPQWPCLIHINNWVFYTLLD